jgi:hypothetical protein
VTQHDCKNSIWQARFSKHENLIMPDTGGVLPHKEEVSAKLEKLTKKG